MEFDICIYFANLSRKFKFRWNMMRKTGTLLEDQFNFFAVTRSDLLRIKMCQTQIIEKIRTQFDVRKSMHHHTIQLNQPTRCNSFTSLLLDVYVWLNMFRVPPRPSSGAYNCARRLWFHHWSVEVGALLVVETTTNSVPTTTLQR
jgi:hypothetical protein